jgi:hypothetical protein
VLLLGDEHYSETGRCDPCDAPECYPIESVEFLQALDAIAKDYPIDFYTESTPLLQGKSENKGAGVLFHRLLQQTVRRCHHVPSRIQPANDSCPTQHIRWHYADLRTFPHLLEGYLIAPVRLLLEANRIQTRLMSIGMIRTVHPAIGQVLSSSALFQEGQAYGQSLIAAFSGLFMPLTDEALLILCHLHYGTLASKKKTLDPAPSITSHLTTTIRKRILPTLAAYSDLIERMTWTLFGIPSSYKALIVQGKVEKIKRFLETIVDVVCMMVTMIQTQLTAYVQTIMRAGKKSGLWKQHSKSVLPFFRDPGEWVTIFCKDILTHPAMFSAFIHVLFYNSVYEVDGLYRVLGQLLMWKPAMIPTPVSESMRSDSWMFQDSDPRPVTQKVLTSLFHAVVWIEKSLLELYLLLRMLKTPGKGQYEEEGVAGSLAIAFLGDLHSQHLRRLLLSPTMGYEETIYLPAESGRCLTFPSLALREELAAHASKQPRWESSRQRHSRRVAEETRRRARNKNRKTNRNRGNNDNNQRWANRFQKMSLRSENDDNAMYGV